MSANIHSEKINIQIKRSLFFQTADFAFYEAFFIYSIKSFILKRLNYFIDAAIMNNYP